MWCLHNEIEMKYRHKIEFEVYTILETKIILSPYDDKQYIVSDSTYTLKV